MITCICIWDNTPYHLFFHSSISLSNPKGETDFGPKSSQRYIQEQFAEKKNPFFCQTSLCLLLLKAISAGKKKSINTDIKSYCCLCSSSHHMWPDFLIFCDVWTLISQRKPRRIAFRSLYLCLQTKPSLPIRQTSGVETMAKLPHGASIWVEGQAVLGQNSSGNQEVSVKVDKWGCFWH